MSSTDLYTLGVCYTTTVETLKNVLYNYIYVKMLSCEFVFCVVCYLKPHDYVLTSFMQRFVCVQQKDSLKINNFKHKIVLMIFF